MKMYKICRKITAAVLCIVLGLGPAACSGETVSADPAKGSCKDETVYVFTGADGTVNRIVVSDWIENGPGLESVADRTDLTDIEIVKGDTTFTLSGNELTLRDAGGNDIYYRGTTQKELPLGLSVSYTLDGESVPAAEMAGKSGRVTIRFDYDARLCETVTVDGQEKEIHVPFIALTGMLLDNDIFRNVEVSGGVLINDGDRSAVIGLALPGLTEDLGAMIGDISIPDHVEITADVTDFAFGITVTLATGTPFGAIDPGSFDLTAALSGLMAKLTGGSTSLMGGLTALLGTSDDPAAGVKALALAAKLFDNGKISLGGGASLLSSGAAELSQGLDTLKSNNETLNGGAKQVFDTLLASAATQLRTAGIDIPDLTVENYATILDALPVPRDSPAYDAVQALKASLDDYNAFYLGLLGYTEGVARAADGAASLTSGTSVLQKIADLADEELGGIVSLLEKIVEVSKNYRNFSGLGEDMDGRVKFIYRTEEIRSDN